MKRILLDDCESRRGSARGADLYFGLRWCNWRSVKDICPHYLCQSRHCGKLRATIDSIELILKPEGAALDDVVKVSAHPQDARLFLKYNAVYARRFRKPYPARTTAGSDWRLVARMMIEIGDIAYVGKTLEFVSDRMAQAGLDPVAGYTLSYESSQRDTALAREYPLALVTPADHYFLNSIFANVPRQQRRSGDPSAQPRDRFRAETTS